MFSLDTATLSMNKDHTEGHTQLQCNISDSNNPSSVLVSVNDFQTLLVRFQRVNQGATQILCLDSYSWL